MSIIINTDGRRLLVKSPFTLKDTLKSVVGARWDSSIRMWTYPFTFRSIDYLAHALSDAGVVDIKYSPEVVAMYEGGDPYTEASEIKTSTELPNPPLCIGDDWLHQRRAFWWAEKLPAVLFDMWMGTGKTAESKNQRKQH